MFPPDAFPIWCNDGSNGGPTFLPAAKVGGHSCCKNEDFCNTQLQPLIRDYSTDYESRKRHFEGGIKFHGIQINS